MTVPLAIPEQKGVVSNLKNDEIEDLPTDWCF